MRLQVEVGSIGDALELPPAPGELVLDVAGAIAVVGELLRRVGADADAGGVDADGLGVPALALVDPVAMPLGCVGRAAEELDLHALELERAEDEAAGRDLVAEAVAGLGDAEGELAAHGAAHVLEVDEHALGRLRGQVGGRAFVDHRSHLRAEHEVEEAGLGELAAAAGAAQVAVVVAHDVAVLALLDVVGAEALAAVLAVDEGVVEGGGVAARDPDLGVREHGRINADHVVAFAHHGAPPGVADVAFQLDAEGAVVVGVGETAVDLGGGEDEAPALGQGDDGVEVGCRHGWFHSRAGCAGVGWPHLSPGSS